MSKEKESNAKKFQSALKLQNQDLIEEIAENDELILNQEWKIENG